MAGGGNGRAWPEVRKWVKGLGAEAASRRARAGAAAGTEAEAGAGAGAGAGPEAGTERIGLTLLGLGGGGVPDIANRILEFRRGFLATCTINLRERDREIR